MSGFFEDDFNGDVPENIDNTNVKDEGPSTMNIICTVLKQKQAEINKSHAKQSRKGCTPNNRYKQADPPSSSGKKNNNLSISHITMTGDNNNN